MAETISNIKCSIFIDLLCKGKVHGQKKVEHWEAQISFCIPRPTLSQNICNPYNFIQTFSFFLVHVL